MKNFRTYDLAVKLYKEAKKTQIKFAIKDQLLRASSSIALNLAEGNERRGIKDRMRFFNIALTSAREVQAIIELEELTELDELTDKLCAHLYCLNCLNYKTLK